jgi:hypothetical protein
MITHGCSHTLSPLVKSGIYTPPQRTLRLYFRRHFHGARQRHQFVVFSHPPNLAVLQSIPASGTQSTIQLLTQPGFCPHQHLKLVWLRAHGVAHKYASAVTGFESS